MNPPLWNIVISVVLIGEDYTNISEESLAFVVLCRGSASFALCDAIFLRNGLKCLSGTPLSRSIPVIIVVSCNTIPSTILKPALQKRTGSADCRDWKRLDKKKEGKDMKTICAGCGNEIPDTHPRLEFLQGELCMECEFTTIPVFKVDYHGGWFVGRDFSGLVELIENMEIEGEYTVKREEMPLTRYLNLPDFEGF